MFQRALWVTCLLWAVAFAVGAESKTAGKLGETSHEARRDLLALFERADDENLANDPLGALMRGDQRFAHEFGDYITRDYFAGLGDRARNNLERLARIDREKLPAGDRISFDTFRHQQEITLRGSTSGASAILRRLPLDHLFGYHVAFPDMSSGSSIAPFRNLRDYENGLRRIEGFVTYLERAEEAMREGIASRHVLPRFAATMVLEQLREAIATGVDGSPLFAPAKDFSDDIPKLEADRVRKSYRRIVARKVMPAYRRLADFVENAYLPASRTGAPGLVGMQDGDEVYRYLVEMHTGSTESPDKIHQIGLREVARIRAEMEAIRSQVGFEGNLQEFFDHLRTDPRFKFESREALVGAYEDVRKRVEPAIDRLFSVLPRSKFEIRPVPAALEKTAGGAYYNAGTPDGSRPGVFYVNTYDLSSRTNPTVETLFLHEAVPGHHLQGSLALENESLPSFLRFGFNTAYIEGWGLYAESLGPELGLFRDPYQRFGHLDLEMFRALRLVVDTGLHAKGWSRERAVSYMLENSSLSRTTVVADVDRYVVWPGQALAYKLGQLTIQRLRAEAEKRLEDAFDIRMFHEQILGSGAVPLPILEAKIRAWIGDHEGDQTSR